MALAIHRQPQSSTAFAVADGRFDRKKIEAYASQFGSLKTADGKILFAVPLNGSNRKAYFTFLRPDRIALANDSSYFFSQPHSGSTKEWREHFSRLAGTPVFVGDAAGRRSGGGVVAGSRRLALSAIRGAAGAIAVDLDQRETGRERIARGGPKEKAWRKTRRTS